jgi:large subunit ribosomal protein L4
VEKQVLDVQGNVVGTVTLSPTHFAVEAKPHVLHEVVCSQFRNYIKKTASSLNRSEVCGSGRKPFRQKGTGRARAGTRRSPLWTGGGAIFGPKPRTVEKRPPKSTRKLAFKMAWSDRFASDAVIVVKDWGLTEIKTRELLANLIGLGASGRVLIGLAEVDEILLKSARNLKPHPGKLYAGKVRAVSIKLISQITVHDIILSDTIVMKEDALEHLKTRMESV